MVTTKQRRLQMVENSKAENALLKLKRFSENGYDEFIEKYRLLYEIKKEEKSPEIIDEAQQIVNKLADCYIEDTLNRYQTPIECVSIGTINIFDYFDFDFPKESSDECDYFVLKSVYEEIFTYYLRMNQFVTKLVGDSKDFISCMALDSVDNHPIMEVSSNVFNVSKYLADRLNIDSSLHYQYKENKKLSINERYKQIYTLFKNLKSEIYGYCKYCECYSGETYLEKMVFCFTGFRDYMLARKIEEYGGKYVSSITSDCNILVCKSTQKITSKIEDARKKGISVISQRDFKDLVGCLGVHC